MGHALSCVSPTQQLQQATKLIVTNKVTDTLIRMGEDRGVDIALVSPHILGDDPSMILINVLGKTNEFLLSAESSDDRLDALGIEPSQAKKKDSSKSIDDALVRGIPFDCDEGSLFAPMSGDKAKSLEARKQFLNNLAYCQYNLEEFANGTALEHIYYVRFENT